MTNQFGAQLLADDTCQWRLWAPLAMHAELVLFDDSGQEAASHRMQVRKYGFFAFELPSISVGQRYAFRLDGKATRPDPASRWQPEGVHRPSAVWRPDEFLWTDDEWRGVGQHDLVIYELHVGTFTREGTFEAIIPRLRELRDLGITAIELMPVAQFPGEYGWGYDGVYWFAVQQSYGGPTNLQRLIDACHSIGIAVILDVVYNHLGPEGNYLAEFGPIFVDRKRTRWGQVINYCGPSCRAVRDLVLENVRQWIRDFHVDGLRLDAVHAIFDDTETHILAEIKQLALEEAAQCSRPVHVIAESTLNDVQLLDPFEDGGYGLDAQWNDDFHHCVHALLTGERDGYYTDFAAPAQQLVKALNETFVYDGAFSRFHGRSHGQPALSHSGDRFVVSVQTHDQIGNRARGDRFGTLLDPPKQRLAAGLLLLSPYIPLLFMGEEYGETRPFPFFCDFSDESLRLALQSERRKEFSAFNWTGGDLNPIERTTFESAVLSWDWPVNSTQAGLRNLYRELLRLRQTHAALRDYQNHSAALISDTEDTSVLLLTRSNNMVPQESLRAVFNLTARTAPVPQICDSAELLIHSEDTRFGGCHNRDVVIELQPFAFAVLAHSTEADE